MTSTKLYPGMCDDSLEFFYIQEEDRLMAITEGTVVDYEELPSSKTQFLDVLIESEHDVKEILSSWSECRSEQKRKLAECRFGGLNFTPDFNNGSYVPDSYDCPHKNSCNGFGVVCKPLVHNGYTLNATDEKAIKLLISSKKNTVIAEELNMPLGSFEVYRTRLYNSLRISTKQELASVVFFLGLI